MGRTSSRVPPFVAMQSGVRYKAQNIQLNHGKPNLTGANKPDTYFSLSVAVTATYKSSEAVASEPQGM